MKFFHVCVDLSSLVVSIVTLFVFSITKWEDQKRYLQHILDDVFNESSGGWEPWKKQTIEWIINQLNNIVQSSSSGAYDKGRAAILLPILKNRYNWFGFRIVRFFNKKDWSYFDL